ncbi:MAG: protein kinase [Sandaracinaceae bacterium]
MGGGDDIEDDPAEWLGRTLSARYRVDEVLGSGGMAYVFGAHDTELGRDVAIKLLRRSVRVSNELRGRFARESRVLAALSHPHIVSLLDFGVEQGCAFLVMERLHGDTLGACLQHGGPLSPARATALLRQILTALSYAHAEGLLHRDLKPDNVFLQELGRIGDHVQLLDFGFAKFTSGDPGEQDGRPLTQAGKIFGTPKYMAPEQLGGSSVDARVDLYAAGVLYFQMLSGRRPFEGELRDVLRKKIVEDPMRLSEAMPDRQVPASLDAFLATALATRRTDRYADAAAMLDALDALPTPLLPEPTPAPSAAPKRTRPLVPLLLGGAGLLGALGLIVIGAVLWTSDPPTAVETAVTDSATVEEAEPDVETPTDTPAVAGDPWADATLAPPVQLVHDAVEAGREVEASEARALRQHARDTPFDIHAQLLLGHLFAARGMQALSIHAYQRALENAPNARHDPRILRDLLGMVAAGGHPMPARLVSEHWSEDALPSIRQAVDNPGLDGPGRTRLRELLIAIEQPPPTPSRRPPITKTG